MSDLDPDIGCVGLDQEGLRDRGRLRGLGLAVGSMEIFYRSYQNKLAAVPHVSRVGLGLGSSRPAAAGRTASTTT